MISEQDILNARILIVDDYRSNILLLEKILDHEGYTSVLSITDSRETLEIYKSYRPDLVLLDIRMPHLDGYQVMEQLKEARQDDYMSILVVTAKQDRKTRLRSLELGAKDFLTKPFDQTETLSRIRNMLEVRLLYKRVKESLDEKEVLLKEIHHRVKNNMAVISSILSLQSQSIKDKYYLNVFRECQDRIRSMAQIHEELYKTKDLAKIDYGEYLKTMAIRIFKAHKIDTNEISLKISVDNIFLDVEKGTPCGLIVNELITNAVKYAFPDGKKGEVEITMRKIEDTPLVPAYRTGREGQAESEISNQESISGPIQPGKQQGGKIELTFSDDGVGLPEDIDYKNTNTLGLQLVIILTQQLGGSIVLDGSKGAKFKIVFEVC